jgi:N-acetylglutamate synthase-like GNAT family acetyltransferase
LGVAEPDLAEEECESIPHKAEFGICTAKTLRKPSGGWRKERNNVRIQEDGREPFMIRNATDEDFDQLYEVINDAAMAYKGVIPEDRWHEPYMTKEELREQLQNGVKFLCYVENRAIVGVMGIQDREEVNLIRHAYVRTERRRNGIGTLLLDRLARESDKPVLIGTWKAASWAIKFYQKHGFALLPEGQKAGLLRKYWSIPERQVETSVVLADKRYKETYSSV